MLQGILQLLDMADGETENIRIAKGKYKLPNTFKETFKHIKNEIKWRNK
tara:strand:+ start:432 stop:578 length:147 start_codon:yes stop_codon:yes gene_type:complete